MLSTAGIPSHVFNSVVELLLTARDTEERKLIMDLIYTEKLEDLNNPEFNLAKVLNRLSIKRRLNNGNEQFNFNFNTPILTDVLKEESKKIEQITSNKFIREMPKSIFFELINQLLLTENRNERIEIVRLVCSEKLYNPDFELTEVISKVNLYRKEKRPKQFQDSYDEIENMIKLDKISKKLKYHEIKHSSVHTVGTVETRDSIGSNTSNFVREYRKERSLRRRLRRFFCM